VISLIKMVVKVYMCQRPRGCTFYQLMVKCSEFMVFDIVNDFSNTKDPQIFHS